MVAQQDSHDFAFGHLPFAVSHSLISLVHGAIWRFLVNSVSKFLQKSSNTQNIYVTLSVEIIAIYVCKLLIFNHKVAKQWQDYQLFREFSYPELALLEGASGALSISVSTRALATTPSKRTLKKWNCVGNLNCRMKLERKFSKVLLCLLNFRKLCSCSAVDDTVFSPPFSSVPEMALRFSSLESFTKRAS